jgi:hypothetical protein
VAACVALCGLCVLCLGGCRGAHAAAAAAPALPPCVHVHAPPECMGPQLISGWCSVLCVLLVCAWLGVECNQARSGGLAGAPLFSVIQKTS